jgi:hypothetical protein
MVNHNLLPGADSKELDAATAEALANGIPVKFSPTEHYQRGMAKEAGEYHHATLCRTPGDNLTFDITSREAGGEPEWMDLGSGGVGAVWVVTESGNRYGIGNGIVYNHNLGGAFVLDHDTSQMQLQVGQEANIPGVGRTSTIKSVLVNDGINFVDGSEPYSWTGRDVSGAKIVNAPVDPLLGVRQIGDAQDPGFAISLLQHDLALPRGNVNFI